MLRKACVCILLLLSMTASAAEKSGSAGSLEERVGRLEQAQRSNSGLVDVMLRLQQLQREVQDLRGQLEVLTYEQESIKKRQRDLYLDVDRRLQQVSGGPPPAAPTVEPDRAEPPPTVGESAAPVTAPGDPALEEASYEKAFELLKQSRFPDAIKAFETFLAKYPKSAYADNAQYWLGEASYVTKNFDQALTEFQKVVDVYPASPKRPGAMLKIGYIHYEKKQWDQAREVLSALARSFPTATEGRLAEQRLERIRREGH